MKTPFLTPQKLAPPLLPALALWGWQAELLPWALGMGALIEAARFSRLRFDIQQPDFNRLWNFTTLLFLGVALYLFLARQGLETVGTIVNTQSPAGQLEGLRQVSQTAMAFLLWLPFILYPFVLAHAWSRSATLPWSTFSLYEQARARRAPQVEPPNWAVRRVHPGHLYLALVLFASCAATTHPLAYLPIFVAVVTWALWPWRNPRYGAPAWIALFLILGAASLLVPRGLSAMRAAWQAMENRLIQGAGGGGFNQLRNATALGSVGRLKQSGRIVLRIRTPDDEPPGLLREAVFNRFRGNIWASGHRAFQPVGPASDRVLWRLSSARRNGRFMTIARYTSEGEIALALPGDTLTIRDLPLVAVETNYLGVARLRNGPPLALYTVEHGEGGGFDGAPEFDDTHLGHLVDADREVIQEVARQLALSTLTPWEAIETVRRHLATGFEYSLWQRERPASTNATALAFFLRESRAGHCEYFAAAMVLLLRAAGVPTRYVVGYSPGGRRGRDWLARARDAHAWCLAFVDGRWRDVDTTPGIWREREAARAGWWEGVADWFSQARYQFALWRQQGGNWRIVVFAVSMVVLGWLAWRQLRGSRWRRTRHAAKDGRPFLTPLGLDSEFFAVARRLESLHGSRGAHETPLAWMTRVGLRRTPLGGPLLEALRLHNRLRFDPRGLPEDERARLEQLARELERKNSVEPRMKH